MIFINNNFSKLATDVRRKCYDSNLYIYFGSEIGRSVSGRQFLKNWLVDYLKTATLNCQMLNLQSSNPFFLDQKNFLCQVKVIVLHLAVSDLS